MCRYGLSGPYKPHYACFSCRKAFKRRLPTDFEYEGEEKDALCPQCGQEMNNMGLDFKPPRQSDRRAWKVLEELFYVGEKFHSCGCSGPGYRPRTPRTLVQYLERQRQDHQAFVQHVGRKVAMNEAPPEHLAYWKKRLKAVEQILASRNENGRQRAAASPKRRHVDRLQAASV